MQEAFMGVLHKASTLEPQVPLSGYLFGFLRIAVLRALRALSRRCGEPSEDELRDTLAGASPPPKLRSSP